MHHIRTLHWDAFILGAGFAIEEGESRFEFTATVWHRPVRGLAHDDKLDGYRGMD